MESVANLELSSKRAKCLNQLEETLKRLNLEQLEEWIQSRVDCEVDQYLGRSKHQKSHKGLLFEVNQPCPGCGEKWSRSFNRNGSYFRNVLTLYGWARVEIPRIKCKAWRPKVCDSV